ncbi:MAG: alpha/beta fold hydrolase [Candidatus Xenobia bacterium]
MPGYTFASHHLTLPDGTRCHYVDEGQGDPVLMVHGNPTWSFYYRSLIEALRPRYRVIAPDHVGCGLSDKPQQYDYRLAQHIDNLEHLVTTLDLRRISLIVHDWGGAIGMGVAGRHPDRFSRFVVSNTAAFRSNLMPKLLSLARVPVLGEALIRGGNAFALGATWLALQKSMSPEVRAAYLSPYRDWATRIATARFVQDIPLNDRHPSYRTLVEVEQGLSRLTHHPMMLVWGERDWVFTPAFLERWIELFPDAQVHRFPDVGHLVLEDAPDRVLPLVEQFLR